jgi:hypothetical protein
VRATDPLAVPDRCGSTLDGSIAAEGTCHDFEQVFVGICEVDAAPPVIVINFVGPRLSGIRLIRQTTCTYASEHGIKALLFDEEGIMLRSD